MHWDGQAASQHTGLGDQRVHAQRALGRLVHGQHQSPGLGGAELREPALGQPDGQRVQHGRPLGAAVVELGEQPLALPGRPPQDGVDQAGAGTRSGGAGQRHRLVDGRVIGDAVGVVQLIQPQAQRRQHRLVELIHGPAGQRDDQMIEGRATLDRPVGQAHGQRAVAPIQPARLGVQGAVGVGAALEDPAHHRERAAAGGRHLCDGGCVPLAAVAHCRGRVAAQEIGGHHRPSSRRLDDEQLERARSAGQQQPPVQDVEGADRGRSRPSSGHACAAWTPTTISSAERRPAPTWGCRARTTRSSSSAGRIGSSRRSTRVIFSA